MIISINNNVVSNVYAKYSGREIIIGIDSSKTNTGIAIGDETGRLLDIIEFNGTNDGTTKEAVLELCHTQRKTLGELLKGAKIIAVGIEDIITKNNKHSESGITVHTSRFKITAVFMSFIFFFQEKFGVTPELINNWEWKAEVLPEEFRSRDIKKGSLAYFRSIGSKYGNYSDDATDSICILQYMCTKLNIAKTYKVKEVEISHVPYRMFLTPVGYELHLGNIKQFELNTTLTLKENADAISNVIGSSNAATAIVLTESLDFEDIYSYCTGTFSYREKKLKLVVISDK